MLRAAHRAVACHPRADVIPTYLRLHVACYSSSAALQKRDSLPPKPKVPEEDTFKRYLKGSGPGGQKINKTSSAVQLTHVPTGIVVKSQATRSRTQNESIARRILAEKVELLEKGSESRVEKKRELVSKKRRSSEKKRRRKYRKLAEGQNEDDQEADELDENEVETTDKSPESTTGLLKDQERGTDI